MKMKTFKEFLYFNKDLVTIVSEELHKKLQDILDAETDHPEYKLNVFTQHVRKLLKNGEDTGLQDDKPKKGSSRAVFFPKDGKRITIDGKETNMPTAVKIAFPGQLDKYRKNNERLLGEHQNEVESDHFIRNHYGMLRETDENQYKTNHEGVLAPVVGNHPEYHHLEMGKVSPMVKSKFKQITKSKSHPTGLSFDDMYHGLNKEYADAHGQHYGAPPSYTEEKHEKTMEHPFVQNLHDMMLNSGMHPGDLRPANMGIWTHPHTGKEYPVVSDYGFNTDIAKHYQERRKRMYNAKTQRY